MSAFSPRQPYLLNVVPARVQCARPSDEPLRCRVDLQTLAYLNRVRENIWIRQCPSVNTATWISTTRPVRLPTLDLLDEVGDGGLGVPHHAYQHRGQRTLPRVGRRLDLPYFRQFSAAALRASCSLKMLLICSSLSHELFTVSIEVTDST